MIGDKILKDELKFEMRKTCNELEDFQKEIDCSIFPVNDAWLAEFLIQSGYELLGKVKGVYIFELCESLMHDIEVYEDESNSWEGLV